MKKILIVDFGDSRPEKIKEIIENFSIPYITTNEKAYEDALDIKPDGIILGGGIRDIKSFDAPRVNNKIFNLNIPIFGICSGMETMALAYGAEVGRDKYAFEKGETETKVDANSTLFKDLPKLQNTHMFHGYSVETLPSGFITTASTEAGPIAAFENKDLNMYGTIFHPEGKYSQYGKEILKNFIDII